MAAWFETVRSLVGEHEDVIRTRRYGVIEVRGGEFVGIHMRPWPKIVSVAEAWWDGGVPSPIAPEVGPRFLDCSLRTQSHRCV